MRVTGKVIANLPAENVEPMGELVDRMVSSCWSLGAALYLLAVWRWRVAHFDAQNDVSREYHAAGFKAQLRYGHLNITRDQVNNVPPQLQVQLSTTICKMLGGDWDGQDGAIHRPGFCYLIAFAGSTTSQPHAGGSGTLVVKVHYHTGRHEIQYLSSNNYSGKQLGPQHAAQLGLLRGLRRCYTQHWSPVRVMGDQEDIIKRQDARKPPRAGHLKGGFWKTRRAADAAAVEDWTFIPRELNRIAQELGRLALTTGQSVEWFARELPAAGARWAGILSFARHDVKRWLDVHQNTTPPAGVAATV
ncbi:hypothetical protein PF003_g14119 [Phytophthora fragariae]|nr:hypothetical protein PF003_g14119 [Phytophthora fragariae]